MNKQDAPKDFAADPAASPRLSAPSAPPRSPDSDSQRTLIDDLLAEQSELTAVEIFARAHDACEVRGRRYEKLLPASAPAPGQQYAFEVNLDTCSGCKACVTACHSMNGLDDDETWRSVGALVSADVRAPLKQTVTTACHHCVDPACLNGCPVLAYDKDPVTGIVKHLDDQCIGCQYCVMMCPYEVPQFLPKRGIVRKCDMCSSRLAVGEAPACVQACPNEAIKITLVEQNRVRGKYRQLSTFNFQPSTASPSDNKFLADSPNPAITLPTTRYVTKRTLPSDLEAADAHDVQPSKAHPPLTLMLVLSQLGVGLAVVEALAGDRSRTTELASLLITLIGVVVGTLHLGQPLKAWRSFLGWRKSWLSRELIAFGAFLGALGAHVVIQHPVSAFLAAFIGLGAVFCSAMIYVDTRRPFWNAPMTLGKFFGTTLLLGAAAMLLLASVANYYDAKAESESQRDSGSKPRVARNELPWESATSVANPNGVAANPSESAATPLGLNTSATMTQGSSFLATLGWRTQSLRDSRVSLAPLAWIILVIGLAIKLATENRIFSFLVDEQDPHLTALNKTALLLHGRFGLATRLRVMCAVAGGIILPVLALSVGGVTAQLTFAATALVLCFAGELIERHLFFVAEVAPKMPGGGTT